LPVSGATFGVATMSENSPHNGEMHPDGDEVLYLISGRVRVVFPDDPIEDIDVNPGDGLVVPRGIWHRVDILEPCQIVYLTPGPNNEYRPLLKS
jgi:mannose-6-phosphate isomerase-like protein (cupin superfamily)